MVQVLTTSGALISILPAGPVSEVLAAGLAAGVALALMVPVFSTFLLADRMMRPPCFCRPLASTWPLFLTTPPTSLSIDWALRMIRPPGACTA